MNQGPVRTQQPAQMPGGTSQHPGGQPLQQIPSYDFEAPKPGMNKLLPVVAVLGLGVACFGLIRGFVSPAPQKAEAATPVAVDVSPFAEQTRMMREAMQMAREAQEMQRERMEMMRREMEYSEGGYDEPQ